MISVSVNRSFSAVHSLPVEDAKPHYLRLHGHSFEVQVSCADKARQHCDQVVDLEDLTLAVDDVLRLLNNQNLNEVPGLGAPTLENLARFFITKLIEKGLPVSEVEVSRPSMGHAAKFTRE